MLFLILIKQNLEFKNIFQHRFLIELMFFTFSTLLPDKIFFFFIVNTLILFDVVYLLYVLVFFYFQRPFKTLDLNFMRMKKRLTKDVRLS